MTKLLKLGFVICVAGVVLSSASTAFLLGLDSPTCADGSRCHIDCADGKEPVAICHNGSAQCYCKKKSGGGDNPMEIEGGGGN